MSQDASAEAVVRDFCEAWSRRDVDEILSYFADDAIYHNIPLDPAVGKEAIRALLEFFVPPSSEISFEIVHLAASSPGGDVVHTERVDRFLMGDRNVVLPVAGVFEIRDGKIAAWRDYFDMQAWISQTTG
jgi:limonene-1,2-epoxide hydrolase